MYPPPQHAYPFGAVGGFHALFFATPQVGAHRSAVLMLSSVNLPGGQQRMKTYEDQLQMRSFFQEHDLISVGFSSFIFIFVLSVLGTFSLSVLGTTVRGEPLGLRNVPPPS